MIPRVPRLPKSATVLGIVSDLVGRRLAGHVPEFNLTGISKSD